MKKYKHEIFTIPNLLSLSRIIMIPIIVWLFYQKQDYLLTLIVFVISSLTDIIDGYIARHYHMVTKLGKILDPIADKMTQFTLMVCLVKIHPLTLYLLIALIIKEFCMALMGLFALAHDIADSAKWYGKLSTVVIFICIILHLLIVDMTMHLSLFLIIITLGFMSLSLVMYARQYYLAYKNKQ